jgi:hypothetical protein
MKENVYINHLSIPKTTKGLRLRNDGAIWDMTESKSIKINKMTWLW